jgi:RNA polymerase sigma-70 factor, ECF subfamily
MLLYKCMEQYAKGEELTDATLVRRTQQGDATAFAQLHRRYYTQIYRLALFQCRKREDAEDIAAETFVKAITHLGTFQLRGETLFPWLARIANNLIIDQGRRASAQKIISLDSETHGEFRTLLESLPDRGPTPEMLAEREEMQEMLRSALSQLPADQSEAILLRFGSDLSLREIAQHFGRSEGAVKSLLHRGLANLRKGLHVQLDAVETIVRLQNTIPTKQIGEEQDSTMSLKARYERIEI